MGSDPNLPEAFAHIATIDEIAVIDADTNSRALLEQLSGPVKRVHVEYFCDEESPRLDEDESTLR